MTPHHHHRFFCVRYALLLLLPLTVRAALNLGMYELPDGDCIPASTSTKYRAFRARRGPLPPVKIASDGDLLISYPVTEDGQYDLEGVLINETTGKCSYCPYEASPQKVNAEFVPSSGIRTIPTPMYGPCLSGLPSTLNRMVCVQHQALYPPDYCGEYFFPNQRLNPHISSSMLLGAAWNPYFRHSYIEDAASPNVISNVDALGQRIDPSLYALGKSKVLDMLSGLEVVYPNGTISNALQAPYWPDEATGVENWPRWTQHHCRVSCHRDSMLAFARPIVADFKDIPQRFFLSRVGGLSTRMIYARCLKCPTYQAAYYAAYNSLSGKYMVYNPRDQGFTYNSQCYPWFGSVPTRKQMNGSPQLYEFSNEVMFAHTETTDGIMQPLSTYAQVSVPCGVDTYNDRCAHYFIINASADVSCQPCPVGYHTAGRTGAWFCLPPAGQTAQLRPGTLDSTVRETLNLFVDATTNQSLAWARRDLLAYEWECGTLPEHCYQCSNATGTLGLTPIAFNQKMIVAPLLVWQNCPEGHYCPKALDPPVPCPLALPWSPAGSANISQCACRAGTYRIDAAASCVACPTAVDKGCGVGTYLKGSAACFGRNGAISGGQCAICTN